MKLSKLNQTVCLDNISVGIICFDSSKKCIYINKYMIDFFGEYNINAKNMLTIYRASIHSDDRDKEIDICNDYFDNNIEHQSTVRLYNQEKREYRWMFNKRSIVKNLGLDNPYNSYIPVINKKDTMYIYTLYDVHDKVLTEQKLESDVIKAQTSNNHKSIFLANVNHELRTPLHGILGMLTLLEDTPLNSEQRDYLLIVRECSFNLMSIINDILDYSKLEVGKISIEADCMSLHDCVEKTNDILLPKIYEKSLVYNYNIANDIPYKIYGDSNRIKQVLLNLLGNSVKFTEVGDIILDITKITETDFLFYYKKYNSNVVCNTDLTCYFNQLDEIYKEITGKFFQKQDFTVTKDDISIVYLRFDITDTGCGIEIFNKDEIFKSFTQVQNSLTAKIYQGTGLGLSICKELVELMNGVIWLDWSELGKGSTFSFIIPFYTCKINTDNISSDLDASILKDKNVLIVDDNFHNRISLSGILKKWEMNPYAYSNAEEALYFSRIIKFDIGLIDICMPKMDGIEFSKKFKSQDNEFDNKSVPLIALSSLGDKIPNDNNLFKANIIKPIKESKLKKLCINYLQQNTREHVNTREHTREREITSGITRSQTTSNKNEFVLPTNKNIKILIAEDILINQKVIISFLHKLGYNNIKIANDGKQCLDIALNEEFDVILLDIIMPIMNGEVVLEKLLEHYSQYNKVKPRIIAVTAYCLREDKKSYLEMGFDDYIIKPVNIDVLKEKLL